MPLGGPRTRRVFIKCMWFCLAGLVLCLGSVVTLLALGSPRFNMGQPWFDTALELLKALLLFFSLFSLVLRFLFQLTDDGPGDSSERRGLLKRPQERNRR